MTIVHGQSEYKICSSIKSNLKIKHEIIAERRGKNSIQVNGLMNILTDSRFCSFKKFVKFFPDIEHSKGELKNFNLFIIMDLDDCSLEKKNQFKNKEMFAKHWLSKYIIPIYNDPDLERTMMESNIEIQKKSDYISIFPTNHGDLDLEMAIKFANSLKKCRCSNLYQYVEHCICIATEGKSNSY